jgi:hypothetical protein
MNSSSLKGVLPSITSTDWPCAFLCYPVALRLELSTEPLSSSGQSSWILIQMSRVAFSELPDYLRSSRSGTGSTKPREDNWGASSRKLRLRSRKPKLTAVGDSLWWPSDTLYPLKLARTSPTSGGHSVGIVRLRTQATEFSFILFALGRILLNSFLWISTCILLKKKNKIYQNPHKSSHTAWWILSTPHKTTSKYYQCARNETH